MENKEGASQDKRSLTLICKYTNTIKLLKRQAICALINLNKKEEDTFKMKIENNLFETMKHETFRI